MNFFKPKKKSLESTVTKNPDDTENIKIRESLYKQNSELATKNKTLSLLSKLYEISILSLESRELATRISQVVQTDLSFELVGILIFDSIKQELTPIGFSSSERVAAVQSHFNNFFKKITIPVSKNPFLLRVIDGKRMAYTDVLTDILDSLIPKEMFEEIKSSGHIKSSLVYPLVSGEKVIGILLFSLNRLYNELIDYEKDSINSFINVVAVAIDKALLGEELKISNSRQEDLIHFIAHQVKGFLTKSKYIFAELADGTYGDLKPEVKKMVTEGLKFNTDGVNVVQDVLHAANVKTGKVTYEKQSLDFSQVVRSVFAGKKRDAEEKNLVFVLNIKDGDYKMIGDSVNLDHAVRNLVDNAVKYTPKGGKVEVSLNKDTNKITLSIKDNGVGITPEDREKLFTEGGRGKNSQKINVDSTGFGLFIVKGIIEGHGGTIQALSEGENKGSNFVVELPVK